MRCCWGIVTEAESEAMLVIHSWSQRTFCFMRYQTCASMATHYWFEPIHMWTSIRLQLEAFQQGQPQLRRLKISNAYTMYTKVCEHPFKWLDLPISATSVADGCIRSSIQPCNLHRQTWAVLWPYWRAQWLSTWHCYRMPPFQQVCSSHFCPAISSPVNCKCCYCEVETSKSNNGSATKW